MYDGQIAQSENDKDWRRHLELLYLTGRYNQLAAFYKEFNRMGRILCESAGKRAWIVQLPDASGRVPVGERYGAQSCGIGKREGALALPASPCGRALLHGGSTSGIGLHGGCDSSV